MIFGVLVVGAGIGLVAAIAAIIAGASLLSALLIYSLAGCAGATSVLLTKMVFCRADKPLPPANMKQSNSPKLEM